MIDQRHIEAAGRCLADTMPIFALLANALVAGIIFVIMA